MTVQTDENQTLNVLRRYVSADGQEQNLNILHRYESADGREPNFKRSSSI